MKRYTRLCIVTIVFVLGLLLQSKQAKAINIEKLRVGFIISDYKEISRIHDFKFYSSYLDELSKYTDIVYVAEPLRYEDGIKKLKNNEIQLLLPVDDTINNMYENMIITNFSYSRELLGLFIRPDDERFKPDQIEKIKGKTVGFVEGIENVNRLREFDTVNRLKLKKVVYKNHDELVSALTNKEVDLVLDTSASGRADKEKLLIGFDTIPVGIAAMKSKESLIKEIDTASWQLHQQNPKFELEYFNELYNYLHTFLTHFTPSESTFIKKQRNFNVMLVGESKPLVYYPNGLDGEPEGIYPDLIKELHLASGLNFNFVYADDYYEAWDKLRKNEADLLIDVYSNVPANRDFKYTNSLYDEQFVLIKRKNEDVPKGGNLALPIECPAINNFVNHEMPTWNTVFNRDSKEALKSLNSGEVDAAIISMNVLQMEKLLTIFPNLVIVPNGYFTMPTNLAIAPGMFDIMQPILNKAILRIDESKVEHIVYKHTLVNLPDFDVEYLMVYYPIEFSIVIIAILTFILVIICFVFYVGLKNKQQKVLKDKNTKLKTILDELEKSNTMRDEYKLQAELDPLTNLLNREAFQKIVKDKLRKFPNDGRCHVLIIMDLDHFKEANDTKGHQYGDEVLKEVADILRSVVRKEDAVARFGGDEFLLFVNNIPENSIEQFATRINKNIRAMDKCADGRPQISASIGISKMPNNGLDYTTLLSKADNALYAVKAGGRDGYLISEEI